MFEGEYIGLKDKNGKPIHEGDLIQNIYNDTVERVYYNPDIAKFEIIYDGEVTATSDFELIYGNECEVVGSIYDKLSPKKKYKKQDLINRAVCICAKLNELINESNGCEK